MSNARFTAETTEGYTTEQFAELNRRYAVAVADAGLGDADSGEMGPKSALDHIAERVLADYDTANAGANYDKRRPREMPSDHDRRVAAIVASMAHGSTEADIYALASANNWDTATILDGLRAARKGR